MIDRKIYSDIIKWIGEEKIILIKGSRQVGKTTLLHKLKEDLEKKNRRVFYYAIDQEIGNPIFKTSKNFITYFREQLIGNEKIFLILDEFQYLENSGMFLKVLFDILKTKVQIIVSGSSSLEISRSTEFLTGRKIEFNLFTLDFQEIVNYNLKIHRIDTFEELTDFNNVYYEELKRLFLNYTNYGGYPEAVIKDDPEKKKDIVKEIISTYLQKDVSGFLKVENIIAYNNLIKILSSQIGCLVNMSELSNTTGINIDTCKKYLSFLEGTYVFYFVKPFFTNIRKEISKMPKVYVSDPSIHKVILNKANYLSYEDIPGDLIENIVFKELLTKKKEINYYRTVSKSDIDFIFKDEGKFFLLESKFRNDAKISIAMKNFGVKHKIYKKIIITKNLLQFGDTIYIPAYLFPFCDFVLR